MKQVVDRLPRVLSMVKTSIRLFRKFTVILFLVAGSSSKYPQNRIQNNAYDLSQSPPMLTNSKSGANQSFDTAIEDPPYSSTPSTDYD